MGNDRRGSAQNGKSRDAKVRSMCEVKMKGRISGEGLKKSMGIEGITVLMRRGRLRWYGHVQRKDDAEWVKKCIGLEVEGKRGKGRPKLTWMEVVR